MSQEGRVQVFFYSKSKEQFLLVLFCWDTANLIFFCEPLHTLINSKDDKIYFVLKKLWILKCLGHEDSKLENKYK